MSNVLAGMIEKVKAKLPDQIGLNARWTDDLLKAIIIAADRATRDLCEVHRLTTEITLTDDTISYDVPTNYISIDKVEFSLDGTNYDWLLQSRSTFDLDAISHTWRTDRSTRPDFYTMLSAVGVQGNGTDETPSQILLYPALTTAGSAKIRVTGVAVPLVNQYTSAIQTAVMPEDVQSRCLVPYVLSVLFATSSPERSAGEYQKFKSGCEEVRNRFRSQFSDHPSRTGGYA